MTTSLDLTLGDALLARVRAAAAEAGMSPEAWAAGVIADALARQGVSEDAAPFDAAGEDPHLSSRPERSEEPGRGIVRPALPDNRWRDCPG